MWPAPIIETITAGFSSPGSRVLLVSWLPLAAGGELTVACDAARVLGRKTTTSSAADLAAGSPAGRADLIVASLPAHHRDQNSLDALMSAAAARLVFGGILAVYTHSDWSSGRLSDPAGQLVAAAQNADLLFLQHIVALLTPFRSGRVRLLDAAGHPHHEIAAFRVHVRAHGDVLVFAQAHADADRPANLR